MAIRESSASTCPLQQDRRRHAYRVVIHDRAPQPGDLVSLRCDGGTAQRHLRWLLVHLLPRLHRTETGLRGQVEAGQAHAALVLDGEEAIAWAEYGTVDELPNIHHRKQYLAEADITPDYRITCVFVDKRHRRQGVTELAITGALDLITQAGGGRVESYPHDLTHQTKKMSASFLYNGTRGLYERLGFTYDRPTGLKNCVMVNTVEPQTEQP